MMLSGLQKVMSMSNTKPNESVGHVSLARLPMVMDFLANRARSATITNLTQALKAFLVVVVVAAASAAAATVAAFRLRQSGSIFQS